MSAYVQRMHVCICIEMLVCSYVEIGIIAKSEHVCSGYVYEAQVAML